VRYIYRVKQAC